MLLHAGLQGVCGIPCPWAFWDGVLPCRVLELTVQTLELTDHLFLPPRCWD